MVIRQAYQPNAESISKHVAPRWWSAAKFGILITWGPYSVPAFAKPSDSFFAFAEWYWLYQQVQPGELEAAVPGITEVESASNADAVYREHHRRTYGEEVCYDDFIEQWQAEAWEPDAWIRLFEEAGARYFVQVAKHHDGFALWPTSTSDRHAGALGPRRDLVGELMTAAAGSSLHTGIFYAMAEWFNPAPRPRLLADPTNPLFDFAFNRPRPARNAYSDAPTPYAGYLPIRDYAADHVVPQITELIDRYHPEIFWFDLPGDPDYYQSHRIVADFYTKAAVTNPDGVVVNDRAGLNVHGDFHTFFRGLSRHRHVIRF